MNLASISSKQRYYLTLAGLAALALTGYQFSLKKTLAAWQQHGEYVKAVATASVAPGRIMEYRTALDQLEGRMAPGGYDREGLFEAVNTYCQQNPKLGLRSFQPEQRLVQNDIEIISNPVETEGSFGAMVNLAYELEYTRRLGRIGSLQFRLQRDPRTRKEYLRAKIYLQYFQPLQDD